MNELVATCRAHISVLLFFSFVSFGFEMSSSLQIHFAGNFDTRGSPVRKDDRCGSYRRIIYSIWNIEECGEQVSSTVN